MRGGNPYFSPMYAYDQPTGQPSFTGSDPAGAQQGAQAQTQASYYGTQPVGGGQSGGGPPAGGWQFSSAGGQQPSAPQPPAQTQQTAQPSSLSSWQSYYGVTPYNSSATTQGFNPSNLSSYPTNSQGVTYNPAGNSALSSTLSNMGISQPTSQPGHSGTGQRPTNASQLYSQNYNPSTGLYTPPQSSALAPSFASAQPQNSNWYGQFQSAMNGAGATQPTGWTPWPSQQTMNNAPRTPTTGPINPNHGDAFLGPGATRSGYRAPQRTMV